MFDYAMSIRDKGEGATNDIYIYAHARAFTGHGERRNHLGETLPQEWCPGIPDQSIIQKMLLAMAGNLH